MYRLDVDSHVHVQAHFEEIMIVIQFWILHSVKKKQNKCFAETHAALVLADLPCYQIA